MKLTLDHELHIRNVQTARQARDEAKITARQRAQAMIDAEISAHQHEVDRAVRVAVEAGVPKRQVGILGLGTSDYKTLQASLGRTEGLAAATIAHEESDPLATLYSITENGHLRVTLDAERMAEGKKLARFDDAQAQTPEYADFTTKLNRGVTQLDPIDGPMLENYERNPIVSWAFAHEAEALGWYAERNGTEAAAA